MNELVNPHAPQPTSPMSMIRSLWVNRQLIWQMSRREVIGRYRGSVMGLAWSFFNPILMLIVYTFVFSVVFKAKWGMDTGEGKSQFAIVLFVGMIVHGLFAEVLNRAPSLILSNANYVKKVVFPLEILPAIAMGAAVFHAIISVLVLSGVFLLFNGYLHWTIIFIPLVIAPLIIIAMGFSWVLASLGVYVRDVGQGIGVIVTVIAFLAPVFYPLSALPKPYQYLLYINPITFIIEQARAVLIFGRVPSLLGMTAYLIISLLVAWVGYWWFQKTRKGFADVL